MNVIICTVLLCVTYFICTKIRTNAYINAEREYLRLRKKEMTPKKELPKSPYYLKRSASTDGRWGYGLFDTRTNDFIRGKSTGLYQIFLDVNVGLRTLNEIEALEGFELSTIGDE
jgi:hypothetical protein